jgi:site-specific DNA-methyltransferase (adenine-specific)
MAAAKNLLYYGDNLDVLRRYVKDECRSRLSDPPFNSNATYNLLFKEHSGTKAASQIQAFEDTWSWNEPAAKPLADHVEFRDYLRNDPKAAHEYIDLKRALADQHRNDRERYTDAKASFISEALARRRGTAEELA